MNPGLIIFIAVLVIAVIAVTLILLLGSKNGPDNHRIDPSTSQAARQQYKDRGYHLIYSNEMNDMRRIKDDFVFEEQAYGTVGTGDQNYVGAELSQLTPNGLLLGCMPNTTLSESDDPSVGRYIFDGSQWDSSKITGRTKLRFKYGIFEFRARCPQHTGSWPAGWLNFCNGQYGPDPKDKGSVKLLNVQKDWPYICPMYWPPEIDVLERWSPILERIPEVPEGMRRVAFQNQFSVHSANQFSAPAENKTSWTWCPTKACSGAPAKPGPSTPSNPCVPAQKGQGYCFGNSVYARDRVNAATDFITYRCEWTPLGISFYMDDVYYGSLDYRELQLYRDGHVGPIKIPNVPMFPIFNVALTAGHTVGIPANQWGICSEYNFDEQGDFKFDGLEIAWVRIYQDDSGTGLNPPLSEADQISIFSNKAGVNLYSSVSNTNQSFEAAGEPTDQETKDAIAGANVDRTCQFLRDRNDNFCLGLDAALVANDNGYLPNSIPFQKSDSVLAYASDKHNVNCAVGSCRSLGYQVMPSWFKQSDAYNKYGWPKKPQVPSAPCRGVLTVDGTPLTSDQCV